VLSRSPVDVYTRNKTPFSLFATMVNFLVYIGDRKPKPNPLAHRGIFMIELRAGESATNAKQPTMQRMVTEREFEEKRLLLTLPINGDGKLVKEIRTALGLSRENFAKLVGVTAESMRLMERGKLFLQCHTKTLLGIAKAFEQIGIRFTHDDRVWEIVDGSPADRRTVKPGDRYAGEMDW
jgi:DNA-binding transcriptional regulator YiaG